MVVMMVMMIMMMNYIVIIKRSWSEEAEKSLHILVKLATNWECVPAMLDSLLPYLRGILPCLELAEAPGVEKYINELFNTLLQDSNLRPLGPKAERLPLDHNATDQWKTNFFQSIKVDLFSSDAEKKKRRARRISGKGTVNSRVSRSLRIVSRV
ncbi:1-phosphatidylinositol-4,5-bisphosphate phosphodiesterase epsilon-1 [Elysia marginata]|uniref:1-phosphatidylinositol-4,5-bisphosphate phosphodiesterase epsilon-1 n=1 Tax=Elysia marginata TaxID=1093978 RepID=A0AAV4GBN1_9GAST|nr:1-phosphatidylinositol-4,5-bisphosphate phosphodiesterase epsilon-1 [Elysia marginata]